MRQIIVGADVASVTTAGCAVVQSKNAHGQAVSYAAGGDEIRIARIAASGEATVASPWFTKEDIVSISGKTFAAAVGGSITITFSDGGTDISEAVLKIIETSAGYEPFERVLTSFNAGAATKELDAAAFHAAFSCDFVTSTDNADGTVTLAIDAGKNIQIAYDAGDADSTLSVGALTGAVEGVGAAADVLAGELLLQGRQYGSYDRLVAFKTFAEETFAVAAEEYNVYNIKVKNSAEGQIRGVDNVRDIMVCIPQDVTIAAISGALTADTAGFEIDLAAFSGNARLLLDDPA